MLDPTIQEQLRSHFASLDHRIDLVVRPSDHPKQPELLAMLQDVADCSPHVSLQIDGSPAPAPEFSLHKDGVHTGIVFRAIPGGHEFTSLILAILHADGKGRWPDTATKDRIRCLAGPLELRTYMALSCTNCPDVVQALNQIALLHPHCTHSTIDGELASDEVRELGIQGVPAVYLGDTLVHVGKADLSQLLEAIEKIAGTVPSVGPVQQDLGSFDVAVLGGGPAGSAASLYLARKGLRVALVAQTIGGQVNDTTGIDNLVAVASTQGRQLAADLADNLRRHPSLTLFTGRRIESISKVRPFTISLSTGEHLTARQVIIATGAAWRRLGVPGEAEHIGRGVAFCPHCDGPFFAGRDVAVVGGGNSGIEAAIDLAAICRSVLVLEFAPGLKADQVLVDRLTSLPNVQVRTNARTTAIHGDGKAVRAIAWEDRSSGQAEERELAGVFVQIGQAPNSGPFRDLVDCAPNGEIIVDSHNRSSAAGIYAAGDVSTVPYKQIVIAMGEGAKAALAAFEDALRA